jgi:hypothetical protein
MIEVSPVTFMFFSVQDAKLEVRLDRWTQTMERNSVPEMVMAAPVAALIDHRIKAASRK